MSIGTDRSSWTETPLFVDSRENTLFGILTEPLEGIRGVAIVHLRDGNEGPSSGRSRSSALLCRRLASDGFHALRFDYHGVGESTGAIDRFRLDEPFKDDVEACVRRLHDLGLTRVALVGECFGARTVLACRDLAGLEAVALIGIPLRDAKKVAGTTRPVVRHRSLVGYAVRALRPRILRELLDPRLRRRYLVAAHNALTAKPYRAMSASSGVPGWVSATVLHDLDDLTVRGIPVLLVNGTSDPGFEDFNRAQQGTFGEILRRSANIVSVVTVDGRIAACADASALEPAIDVIGEWLGGALEDPRPASRTSSPDASFG